MKVQDVHMSYYWELCETFRLLNYFLRTFALNCVLTRSVPIIHLIRMAVPVAIIGSYNLYTLIYKSVYILNVQIQIAESVQYTDAVQNVYDLIQYLVDLWYVYKYGADACLEYFNRYCHMDELLGMKYYSDVKSNITRFFCFILVAWLLTSLYDYMIWAHGYGFTIPLYFFATYVHMLIKLLSNVHMSLNIMHIEYRLRTIGDHVQTLYANSENLLQVSQEISSSAAFDTNSQASDKSIVEFFKAKKNVKWFRCYYILLLKQVELVNCMFGMRILLNSLSLLTDMVRLINLAVRVIVGSQRTGVKFYPAIGSLVKSLMCAVLLVSITWRSEKAYRQRARLLCLIDNMLITKKIDESITVEIKEFYALVQTRPISFSMADFVRIDNSFLVSTASAVVTYSIILLQSVN